MLALWEEKMENWQLKKEEKGILMAILRKEEGEISEQQHTLESHGKAAYLVGMWNNNTLLKGREFLVLRASCNPEQAKIRVLELMRIAQETALAIEERFRRHHDFWARRYLTGRRRGVGSQEIWESAKRGRLVRKA